MLKSAYFTTRTELLHWVNSTLQLHLTHIEQLGAGNVYCQLLDAAFPGKVPLHRVKWQAKLEIDFIFNFKILQSCFEHLGIPRHIEVQKMVRAKCQDNLEFIQWMKHEFSQRIISSNKPYPALQRRNYATICLAFANTLQKHLQNKSSIYLSNKENSNLQNTIDSPRTSIKTHRSSFTGSATHIPQKHPGRKERNSLTAQSKTDLALLERPRVIHSSRVHTETGPVIIRKRLYTEFILETDEEECF